MISTLYRGSVKDLLGPVKFEAGGNKVPSVIFEYTDAYSVFDWGRMPDALTGKGEALAVLAADFFERLEKPATWQEFSRSADALALRKENRFGSSFNELGEKLQHEGLRTHYIGVLSRARPHVPLVALTEAQVYSELDAVPLSRMQKPTRHLVVRQVNAVKPRFVPVLGRSIPDYTPTHSAPFPRLVPLEVIFRFSCPPGSSIFSRIADDPNYLASIGFPEFRTDTEGGTKPNGFPLLEVFSKLEPSDRHLTLGEALAVSGITADQLQELLFKTAWVAAWLRATFGRVGLEIADGKLEWGVDEKGEIFLVDAIGPDELRILKDGVQLSKEFLRIYYRSTPWYEAVNRAKSAAQAQGVSEWKRFVTEGPPHLPADQKKLAIQLYLSLANELTDKKWFPDAMPLRDVIAAIKSIAGA